MRFRKNENGLSVHAVAGTHVVMLGLDMDEKDTKGLLGFAVHRTDPKENEAYWLQGFRTFEESYPNPPEGALVSSHEHPVQDFLWSDFTAKPGRKYIYHVVPVSGKPKNLSYGEGTTIEVETEKEEGSRHSIYFNRAVIGSQAYSRKFSGSPSALQGTEREEAFKWLSRGLEEGLIRFIRRAKGPEFAIRAAFYEFSHEPVAKELADALGAGADVQIVYDARVPNTKDGTPEPKTKKRVDAVKKLLRDSGLKDVAIPRKQNANFISHNKFMVLLRNGKPVAVWTGSTNITESGIFGHANVGHAVEDREIAQQYLDYWDRLSQDPLVPDLRLSNDEAAPTLDSFPPPSGITAIFSPRSGLDQLAWYADEMDTASELSAFTGAFGVNKLFRSKFQENRDYLRYVFLEKWGVNEKTAAETEADLSNDRDIQVAVGAILKEDYLYRWLKERVNTLSVNVRFVHTKFLLVDPLGEDPVVISGSANFSDASTKDNDENMLVIRGDKRVADIYLGEFMRLWRHHRFRFIVNTVGSDGKARHNYLDATSSWTKNFYKKDSVKFRRRKVFA